MLKYEHIEFLNLLFGVPCLILALFIFNKWKKKALYIFGEKKLMKDLNPNFSKNKTIIKNILTILIFIFLIIGIANPKIGKKMEEIKREGVDLMIAIDLSKSMMAEDIKPNRLERAKQAIFKLINNLKGDRIGLIVFAGEAYVQLPITTDYSAAKLFLSTVNTNLVTNQGTEISKAINLCVSSFDTQNEQNKAIIIITDGENHDDKAIESAKNANNNGIIIHTLGMGLNKGAPIPLYNQFGKQNSYLKDKQGNTVVSKLNEDLLIKIANAGKGTYIRANNSKIGLTKLFAEINKMEKKEIGTMMFTDYDDKFQLFLAIALTLLLINLIITPRNNTWFNQNIFNKKL